MLLKQLSWPIYLFFALHLWRDLPQGRRHVLTTASLVAAASLPFLVWGPVAFLTGLVIELNVHTNIYGVNLLGVLSLILPDYASALSPVVSVFQFLGVGAALVVFLRRRSRDAVGALTQGVGTAFVAFVLARWTSPAYYMLLITLLCLIVAISPVGRDRPSTAPVKAGAS